MRSFTSLLLLFTLALPSLVTGYYTRFAPCVPPKKKVLGMHSYVDSDAFSALWKAKNALDEYLYTHDVDSEVDIFGTITADGLRGRRYKKAADTHGIVYMPDQDSDKGGVKETPMGDVQRDDYSADHILELQVVAQAMNINFDAISAEDVAAIKAIVNASGNLVNVEAKLNTEKGKWTEKSGTCSITPELKSYLEEVKEWGGEVARDVDNYLLEYPKFTQPTAEYPYGPTESGWKNLLSKAGVDYP